MNQSACWVTYAPYGLSCTSTRYDYRPISSLLLRNITIPSSMFIYMTCLSLVTSFSFKCAYCCYFIAVTMIYRWLQRIAVGIASRCDEPVWALELLSQNQIFLKLLQYFSIVRFMVLVVSYIDHSPTFCKSSHSQVSLSWSLECSWRM